jgi:hypothetical protein
MNILQTFAGGAISIVLLVLAAIFAIVWVFLPFFLISELRGIQKRVEASNKLLAVLASKAVQSEGDLAEAARNPRFAAVADALRLEQPRSEKERPDVPGWGRVNGVWERRNPPAA